MPTARVWLRHSRWYYLFVFYSLMSYTGAFYLMKSSSTSNVFATYGVTRKKDYKAELLRELAEDEHLYIATSTIHFLKKVKNMRFKYVTDADGDETTHTTHSTSSQVTEDCKIQNKSISLKNKTLKTFDSLWNMMKTLSDDSFSNDRSKNRMSTTSSNNIDSSNIDSYGEDSDYRFTKKHDSLKKTTTPSKSKGRRFSKKKKIKQSYHKKKKGYKSNVAEDNSYINHISVRRVVNTPACRCRSNKAQMTMSKEIMPLRSTSGRNKIKEVCLTKKMKQRGKLISKQRQAMYKVNNTILLNVNNDAGCYCEKKKKKRKPKTKLTTLLTTEITSILTTTVPTTTISTTIVPTTTMPTTTILTTTMPTTTMPTTTIPTTTMLTTIPTTTKPTTTKKTKTKPTKGTTTTTTIESTMPSEMTTETTCISTTEDIITEDEICPDVFPCTEEKKRFEMPCFLCSKVFMKELRRMHENNAMFTTKFTTRKRQKNHRCGLKSTSKYAFRTAMTLNDKSSKRTRQGLKHSKSTVLSGIFKKPCRIVKRRTSLTPSNLNHILTTTYFPHKRKGCSFLDRKDRAEFIWKECTTCKVKNNTDSSLQLRAALTEDSEAYTDDMKENDYYEEYYSGYDELTTSDDALAIKRFDDGIQDVQALPHYESDGSTMFPEDDSALAAYNLLNLFPFKFGRTSTVNYEYEDNVCNADTTDVSPVDLESVAQKIFSAALSLKNNLEENRSARLYVEQKQSVVRNSMENLSKILRRCNYLLREINASRKIYLRKLQQLVGLSKVTDQVEKRIKGKLRQILETLKLSKSK